MVVLEFFGALVVMFVLWCYDEVQTANKRRENAMGAFPTGYAIEYKTIVDVYHRVYNQYEIVLRRDGYKNASEWVKQMYGQYQLGGENDVMFCYAIIKGREEAIKNNRSPVCYNEIFDGSINEHSVQYGYKRFRADIDESRLRIYPSMSGKVAFDQKNYERLLEIDKKTYESAVRVRKMGNCWNGTFERRFTL